MSVSTGPRRYRSTGGWRGLPGIEHLNVAAKLLLLGFVLLVPFLYILYQQSRLNWTRGVVVGTQELAGITVMTKVEKLAVDLEASRFESASYAAGLKDADALTNLKAAKETIDKDLQDISTNQKELELIGLWDKWQELSRAAEEVATNAATYDSDTTADKHKAVTDQVKTFFGTIGDRSNLALDPEVATHYAIDIFLTRIPDIEHAMGGACAVLARAAGEHRKLSNAQREDLLRQSAITAYQTDMMTQSYEKMIAERNTRYPGGDPLNLAGGLGPFLADARKGIATFTKYTDNVVLGTAKPEDWSSVVGDGIGNLNSFSDTFQPYVSKLVQARVDELKREVFVSLLIGVLALLITGLIGFYIVSDINRPLRATLAVANAIAAGDVSFTIPEVNRGDEFGQLNRSLREMVANLREILNSIGSTVQTLTAATSEIMTTTSQLAVSSTEMATAVNEATTTVEEVKQTAQISSQRAQQVAQSAQQAAQVSQAGRQATDETLEEMNRIKEQMSSIAESIVRLSEQTQAISEIIASVNDLAEQSNLLAVNASIEAAKAGEQGRGFAVVAQEVRHLAEQSKQSTAQVRNILSDIQKATGGAVMVAEQGTKAVDLGVRQSKEAGDSIKTLATRVVEAAQAAVQISASTHQQLVGMDQVVTAMIGIKDGSVQTAASMRNVQTSAQRLYEMTQNLKKLTERYSSN